MKNYTDTDIKTLLSNLCCSHCKNEFTKDSVIEQEKNGDIMFCKLVCTKCGKDFGQIVFNINRKSNKHTPLEIIEGPAPISYDDVIDAHLYIKENM